MHARVIAPALAILLLLTTLPVSPAALAQAAAPPSPQPSTQSSSAPATAAAPATSAAPAKTPASTTSTSATTAPTSAAPAPAAGSGPAAPPITIGDEKLFSQSAQAAVETQQEFGAWDRPATLARINRIGYELAQQTGFTKFPITFHLIDEAEPNAEALPGGQIFVTRGMMELDLDDDMFACMIGHEIGHVIKEHYLHESHRAMLMSILSQVLVAGALISSAHNAGRQNGIEAPYDPRYGYEYGDGQGNLVQGVAVASLIASELMLRSYSRDQEDEADLVGQQLAAAAGYDPDGTRRLWQRFEARSPQLRQYGYLQSHPFDTDRMAAAEAREKGLAIQRRSNADLYRQRTQDVLVGFAGRQHIKEAAEARKHPPRQPRPDQIGRKPKAVSLMSEFVYEAALTAWPRGKTADSIRLARLHQVRDTKLAECRSFQEAPPAADKPAVTRPGAGGRRMPPQTAPAPSGGSGSSGAPAPVFRVARDNAGCAPELHDYGAVERAYRKELADMAALDPTGPTPALAPEINHEIGEFETQRLALYPHSVEIFNGGVYETPFLVAFLSNFPDAPEVPQVALALGESYSRTGNEADAVSHFMTAWQAGPDTASGQRARTGLRNLTGSLKQLAALQELADQDRDPEMKKMAAERLAAVSHTYDDLAVGAEYLRRFPEGEFVVPVLDRLNVLADNLYGEVVLYQGFGDITKASDRINKILTNAPLSPAAEKLRDRAMSIAASEKNG